MQWISRRRVLAAAGTVAIGTVAAAAMPRNSRAQELADPSKALVLTDPPAPVPDDIVFVGADGTEHRPADFRGHGMVVNLWATWCVPCVAEMPALSKLAARLGPQDIAVLPLSSDRGGAAAVQRFYDEHAIGALPVLLDPKGAAARAWGARGIPTTIIIDKQGREAARLEGAADWASDAAAARVRDLVQR